MKFGMAGLFFCCFLATASAQDKNASGPSMASIGLQTGQQAPAFNLPDQFGREQSNETLKGKGGTVLLFFRSADW